MGLLHRWARIASAAPGVANFLTQTPGLASVARAVAGLSPHRALPRFAPETFRAWFAKRRATAAAGGDVILFPDTFTNHFSTNVGRAAVSVLEAAGLAVTLPRERLCCGRPLYDFGMLSTAKDLLAKTVSALSPHVDAGRPVVVLEPSCAAVFKDELPELFPGDERARRLSRATVLFAELLERDAPGFAPPPIARSALVQFHCHQRALFGVEADRRALARSGVDFVVPDAGCCGMAGAFGFEKAHYDVSLAIGEQLLLPEVRRAPADTLIVADGFSCREQIAQATGRRALHLAEVLGSKL